MTRFGIVYGVLLTLAPISAAWAQQPALYGYLGGGGTDGESSRGGALTAGVVGRIGPLLATFTPLDLILYPTSLPAYDEDPTLNTQIRCGDASGFTFVETNRCVSGKYGFSFDVAALIPRTPLFTGAGARFERDHDQWFGTAGYAWFSVDRRTMLAIKGIFGEDLLSGIVSVGFRIGGR